jgi:hypothetical protein
MKFISDLFTRFENISLPFWQFCLIFITASLLILLEAFLMGWDIYTRYIK